MHSGTGLITATCSTTWKRACSAKWWWHEAPAVGVAASRLFRALRADAAQPARARRAGPAAEPRALHVLPGDDRDDGHGRPPPLRQGHARTAGVAIRQ